MQTPSSIMVKTNYVRHILRTHLNAEIRVQWKYTTTAGQPLYMHTYVYDTYDTSLCRDNACTPAKKARFYT